MLHQTNALIEWPEALVALISVAVSVIIVVFVRYIPSLTGGQRCLGAIQAMHTKPTPRLGGLAIFAALLASLPLAPPTITDRYTLFIVAASFLFSVGLAEDLGVGVLFWDQPVMAFLSVLFFAALFGVTYNLAKPALEILSRTVGAAMSRKKRS